MARERASMHNNDPHFWADLAREARERQAMWWEDPRFYERSRRSFEVHAMDCEDVAEQLFFLNLMD